MNLRVAPLFFIVAILIVNSCKTALRKESPQKPNVLLIMSDDQGWYDIGFNGNEEIRTPYMDSLASEGIIFDRFYSASAVCSPTRASFITGRNPLRTNIPYANQGHLKKEEITIPEILKEVGYSTAHFGKWHLGTLSKTVFDGNRGGREEYFNEFAIPSQHGYDTYFCTESKVPTFDPMVSPMSFNNSESIRFGWKAMGNKDSARAYGTAYWIGENLIETRNLEGDDSRVIMDRVVPFIENSQIKGKPFFASIWFHTPHLPVVSDSLHRSYYKGMSLEKQIYYGSITAMDEQIGRLWHKLEELGIEENTIIFYCSDNGPEVRTPGSAGAFRDRKRSLYEGGVRVPAFVVWKNNIEEGQRINFPAVTSDYLPTILDMLQLEYPDNRPVDGISILMALKGEKKKRGKPIGFICKPQISWVTDQYKLIGAYDRKNFELYDLVNDRSEEVNLIAEYPDIAEKLKADLFEWVSSVENSKKGGDYGENH